MWKDFLEGIFVGFFVGLTTGIYILYWVIKPPPEHPPHDD